MQPIEPKPGVNDLVYIDAIPMSHPTQYRVWSRLEGELPSSPKMVGIFDNLPEACAAARLFCIRHAHFAGLTNAEAKAELIQALHQLWPDDQVMFILPPADPNARKEE